MSEKIILINKLVKNGTVSSLLKMGLISGKILFHRNIYLEFDKEVRMGTQRTLAVARTARKFACSERNVYKAIKTFN